MDSKPPCSPSSSLQKRKKKVHFVVRRFSYIEPRSNDPGDYSDLFYSQEDYAEMHVESRAIIQMMQTCLPVKLQNGLCSRGLEDRTPPGARKRIWNHMRAFAAVNREQTRQREEFLDDAEKMAEVYTRFSAPCQKQACRVGKQDAIDAKEILREKLESNLVDKYYDAIEFSDESNKNGSRLESPMSPTPSYSCMVGQTFRQNNFVQVHL
jgi:hypothetical protein